jgi:hypothetical protein
MDTLLHVWESAGLGKAPFKVVSLIELPPRDLLNYNVQAYNDRMSEAVHHAWSLGVKVGTCYYCGHGLINNYVIKSFDDKKFVVGSECVQKTHSEKLVSQQKQIASKARAEKKRVEREVAWEAGRADREARAAERAKADRVRREVEAKQTKDIAGMNSWMTDILDSQNGPFCADISSRLKNDRIAVKYLPERVIEILQDIYAKASSGSRKGSDKYNKQFGLFNDIVYDSEKKIFQYLKEGEVK